MESYTPEQAEDDLRELKAELGFFEYTKNSDSVEQQRRRQNRYWFAADYISRLIHGLQPERKLHLKVGDTPVMPYRRPKLPPGHELDILREDRRFVGLRELRQELCVGWRDRLPLSEIARTLEEGGELSIVEVPVEEQRQPALR